MAVNYWSLRLSSSPLLVSDMEGKYRIIQVGLELPSFQFTYLRLQLHLHKAQYFPLQIGVCLSIPDIDTLHLLGAVHEIPHQIHDVPHGPLIMFPHLLHILPRPIYTKSPLSPPSLYLFLLKLSPLLLPHPLVICQTFPSWIFFYLLIPHFLLLFFIK